MNEAKSRRNEAETVSRRAALKPGEILCSYCTARCCRYFALPLETPSTWEDFDTLRWFIMHGKTAIFVDDDTWYLLVYGDCKHLLPDYRCGHYDERPQICRDYSTDNCEFENDGCYDKFFEAPEQIWEYAEAVLPPASKPKHLAPQTAPLALPVIAT
uniref:YkgJ family cysteine cluster protein n=1 Tax=Schlesneria paludicola TaxID=360056 RepID=A0A7C4QQI6_9PLAN